MTTRVAVSSIAATQLGDLDLWWREHRPASATSVLDEFDHVIGALEEQPGIGVPYERKGTRNVRWLRLRGTPYEVYYHFEPGGTEVTIVAVWSGMRGHGPPLPEK